MPREIAITLWSLAAACVMAFGMAAFNNSFSRSRLSCGLFHFPNCTSAAASCGNTHASLVSLAGGSHSLKSPPVFKYNIAMQIK